jgi:hypothetical protein
MRQNLRGYEWSRSVYIVQCSHDGLHVKSMIVDLEMVIRQLTLNSFVQVDDKSYRCPHLL